MRVLTIQKAYELAVQHQQAGRLGEAESLYRQIISYQADHPEALHRLGLLNYQAGRGPDALQWLRRASTIKPRDPSVQNDLGTVLAALGRASEALGAYRQAITLRPDYPEAHNNIGNALADAGRYEEAVWAYRKAIARRPGFAEAHHNLGIALGQLNRLDESIAAFRQAVAVRADYADAWKDLGLALQQRGEIEPAAAAFRQAIASLPNFPETFNHLAEALRAQGKLDEADTACRQALLHRPAYALAYNTLGLIEYDRGHLDEAITAYRQALSLRQNFPEACNNLGQALYARGELDQAVLAFQQSVTLMPAFAAGYANLGNALWDSGRADAALHAYHRAVELKADAKVASKLLHAVHFHPDYDPRRIYEEHIRWNHVYARPLASAGYEHTNDPNPDRRPRIGYVIPEAGNRLAGRFLLPLLANHHRSEVEVICYCDAAEGDPSIAQLKRFANVWHQTASVSDEQIASRIHADRINVLIDLALHGKGSRMLAFARKPAPVQVAWMAYPGTSGLETMDYRLTDPYLDPPARDEHSQTGPTDEFYAETSIRLPTAYWCYQPPADVPEPGPPPAATGHVTFGCLSGFMHVSDLALITWCALLEQVPMSRLIICCENSAQQRRVYEQLAARGIDAKRVQFASDTTPAGSFELHRQIDIALDLFPFNAPLAACDAMWMGVPIVSLAGPTAVSRAGLSLLANLGLQDLVAHSREEYIRIAADLAGDLPRLGALRSTLRGRMSSSSLMDGPRFAREFEAALRDMWRRWCEG